MAFMNIESGILELLADGLKTTLDKQTSAELGDRSEYLGLSDLSKSLIYERSVLLDKLLVCDQSYSLQTLLRLSQGHWLEHGLETQFHALGISFMRQMEIFVLLDGIPVKAYLDLVLPGCDMRQVTILEIKSAAKP
jgi:hypothetical protein